MIYFRQIGQIHFEEDLYKENTQSKAMKMHESLLVVKFPSTKPQVQKKCFELYFTVLLNLSNGGERTCCVKIIFRFFCELKERKNKIEPKSSSRETIKRRKVGIRNEFYQQRKN